MSVLFIAAALDAPGRRGRLTVSSNRSEPEHRPALARLISVPPGLFAERHWGREPLLSRAAGGFDDLFSLAAADELIATRGLRTPFVRMANEGYLLDSRRFTGPAGFGAEVGDQLDSGKALVEFASGSTIVLQGLHRTWAPIAEFARLLSAEMAAPAQVSAHITPASSRGFDPDYDLHDVFVIQIHGEKHWTIHAPVNEHPLHEHPGEEQRTAVAARAKEKPIIDVTFRPGEVLYLPRGWIHSAVATGGTSIHLAVGVAAFTRWDIARQLITAATGHAALRAPLPLGLDYADVDSLTPVVQETIAALVAALAHPDVPAVASGLASLLTGATRPQPVLPLATVEALVTLNAGTRVSWRPGLDAEFESDDESVVIVLSDKRLTLPIEARDAVIALRAGRQLAGALPALDTDSSLVVVRRLLREAVLVVV